MSTEVFLEIQTKHDHSFLECLCNIQSAFPLLFSIQIIHIPISIENKCFEYLLDVISAY